MSNNNLEAEAMAKCRTFKAQFGRIRIHLNPVVTVVSAIIIWGLMVWAIVDTDRVARDMDNGKKWITDKFTWLYIITQDAWFIFLIVVYFSKYGDMKLGKDDEEPEFSDITYFTMLFASGIGVGLFYFGVAEPMFHYQPNREYGNRYWNRYTDNQRAQDAMNITMFHWGIHGWIVYAVVGLIMGFIAHRKGLPMTIRSCFYPIFGERIFGTVGDIIDICSVVSTMFGVATSLGVGVMTLNSGFNRMSSSIEENVDNQIIIIWVITCLATISVVSGLKLGIRRLSEICFGLGLFLMFFVFFTDNTWFFLNLYVQSIGYYLQWLVQHAFHTEAFAQLGNAPDGKENKDWIEDWTVFYWGWWVTWSPFVGMFIAKISRGRTIRNFLNATLTAPILYLFLWFTIFGGAGLKMERTADLMGIRCNSTLGGRNSTEPNNSLFRLSCRSESQMYFDLIQQYGDNLSGFLNVVSLISAILYFITSSDSGSLVIDCLSANGNADPPILQRIFWAFTEGACATALLKAGGKRALTALQTVAMASGLLYAVILNLMCFSLWRTMQIEAGDYDENQPTFQSGIVSAFDSCSLKRLSDLIVATLVPWWPMGVVAGKVYNQRPWSYMFFMAVLFCGWIILEASQPLESGLAYIGWVVFIGFLAYLVSLRIAVRNHSSIPGNVVGDIIIIIFYPLAVDQMHQHLLEEERSKKDDPAFAGSLLLSVDSGIPELTKDGKDETTKV